MKPIIHATHGTLTKQKNSLNQDYIAFEVSKKVVASNSLIDVCSATRILAPDSLTKSITQAIDYLTIVNR